MNDPAPRYTRTLATLYADQGHYDKALTVYRHLIKQFPDSRDISEGFSDLKDRIQRIKTSNEPELAPLFREWFDLLIKYRQTFPAQKKR
jgi:hypothetical protein